MIYAVMFVLAFAAVFYGVLTIGMRRMKRRFTKNQAAINEDFEAWRAADEAYFSAMRTLLSAKHQRLVNRRAGTVSAEQDDIDQLSSVAEDLWTKAEAARRKATAPRSYRRAR